VNGGRDPLTGKREQITKRGFRTADEAGRERREILNKIDTGQLSPTPAGLTVNDLLDLYLDGIEADGVLSVKTCYDYRHYADDYVRPHLGHRRVRMARGGTSVLGGVATKDFRPGNAKGRTPSLRNGDRFRGHYSMRFAPE
jgi:hypothetical protein